MEFCACGLYRTGKAGNRETLSRKARREATGLTEENLTFQDDGLLDIIRTTTHEAGVAPRTRNPEHRAQGRSQVVTDGPDSLNSKSRPQTWASIWAF